MNRLPISDLHIVGYSDIVTPDWCPVVVPPIFETKPEWRDKNDASAPEVSLYACAPYHYENGVVVDCTLISEHELKSREGHSFTLIPRIKAHVGYELWIDESLVPHYAPATEVQALFKAKSEKAIEQAIAFCKTLEYDKADALSTIALRTSRGASALAALILAGAVAHLRNEATRLRRFAKIAGNRDVLLPFNWGVKGLLLEIESEQRKA